MTYLILMNPEQEDNYSRNIYFGGICFSNDKPYTVTSVSHPFLWKSMPMAEKRCEKLRKEYPDREFMVVSSEFYLSLLDHNLNVSWVMQMRQEQMKL